MHISSDALQLKESACTESMHLSALTLSVGRHSLRSEADHVFQRATLRCHCVGCSLGIIPCGEEGWKQEGPEGEGEPDAG